ncbi:hypothetical protein JN06_01885 [Bacteroides zoogleoformans]|nr:hypothetical protein JN06_01885 [Bacteroides zoogleoformans]
MDLDYLKIIKDLGGKHQSGKFSLREFGIRIYNNFPLSSSHTGLGDRIMVA